MRSETMYVFLTTSRSFYIEGPIPENGRNGLNSAKNVQLRRALFTGEISSKISLTGPKRILVSPAFQQDQDRLNRMSESPENTNFPIRVLFPANLLLSSLPPPRHDDGAPNLPPEPRLAVAVPGPPVSPAGVAGRRRCSWISPTASPPPVRRAIRPVSRFSSFFFFFSV